MGTESDASEPGSDGAGITCRTVTERAGRKSAHDKQHPQGVYRPEREATFVVFRGDDADPFATRYDHSTDEFDPATRIGRNPIPNDDTHGAPALTIDDDGYLHVFYGVHNDPLSYARSARPYDATAWEQLGDPVAAADDVLASDGWHTERALLSVPGGTYTFPLTYRNDLYVLYRTGTEPNAHGPDPEQTGDRTAYPSHEFATIIRSTDRGETWEDLGPVIDTRGARGRPESDAYVEDFDERDGKLHVTWTVATGDPQSQPPRGHDGPREGGYHAYYDPDEDAMFDLAGNRYGSTVTWADHDSGAVRVANADRVPESGWVYNHALADDGVAVVFQSEGGDDAPDGAGRHVVARYRDGWAFEDVPGAFTASSHGHVRTNDAGELEVHVVAAGDDGSGGSDYAVFTRTDSGWTEETATTGETIEGTNTVRDGTDAFSAVANEASGPLDGFSERLWAVGRFDGAAETDD